MKRKEIGKKVLPERKTKKSKKEVTIAWLNQPK